MPNGQQQMQMMMQQVQTLMASMNTTEQPQEEKPKEVDQFAHVQPPTKSDQVFGALFKEQSKLAREGPSMSFRTSDPAKPKANPFGGTTQPPSDTGFSAFGGSAPAQEPVQPSPPVAQAPSAPAPELDIMSTTSASSVEPPAFPAAQPNNPFAAVSNPAPQPTSMANPFASFATASTESPAPAPAPANPFGAMSFGNSGMSQQPAQPAQPAAQPMANPFS